MEALPSPPPKIPLPNTPVEYVLLLLSVATQFAPPCELQTGLRVSWYVSESIRLEFVMNKEPRTSCLCEERKGN